jgi:hypothetical protein
MRMKERFIKSSMFQLLVTLLLVIVVTVKPENLIAQGKSYVSSDRVFIVTYPDDWKINKLETAGEVSLNGPGANLFNVCQVKFEISKLSDGFEKFTIQQLAEAELKIQQAQQDAPLKLEVLSSSFKTVKDHEWWFLKGKLTRNKEVYFTNSYKTIHNGKTYVCTYFSNEKKFQKNEEAAYGIFNSIEFLTKQEQPAKPEVAKSTDNPKKAASPAAVKQAVNRNEIVPADEKGETGKIAFTYGGKKVTYTTVRAADGNIWLQQNLGSRRVATEIKDEYSYGDLFQWGRWDDGHQYRVPANTRNAVAAPNNPKGLNKTGTNPFFYKGFDNWWSHGHKTDTWTASTPAEVSETNGCDPCKALGNGWHMPSKAEWERLLATEFITDENGAFVSSLKLPFATGYRSIDNGILTENAYGGYWSGTPSHIHDMGAIVLNIGMTTAEMNHYPRGTGYSIRCLRSGQ